MPEAILRFSGYQISLYFSLC